MKKIIPFSLIALFITLLVACEKQLDVAFLKEKPLIVMNSVVQPGEAIDVYISKSYSFLDTNSYAMHLNDASVELHINDKFIEKMQLVSIDSLSSPRRGRSTFRSTAHVKIGDRVRIVAKAPELGTAWAETVIPEPPVIGKVDTTSFLLMTKSDVSINGGYNSYGGYGGYNGITFHQGYGEYISFPKDITYERFFRMLRLYIDVQRSNKNNPQYFLLSLSVNEPVNLDNDDSYNRQLGIDTKDDPIFANDPKNSIFDVIFEKSASFTGSVYFSDNAFKSNTYTLNVSTYGYHYIDVKTKKGDDGILRYISHEVKNLPIEIKVLFRFTRLVCLFKRERK